MRKILYFILFLWICCCHSVYAIDPYESLSNPELEARARALFSELRCLVCQNQSIDDSGSLLAKDLRSLVRKRLQEGESDKAIREYIVQRYGEFILLKPQVNTKNFLLWSTPLILLITGLWIFINRIRMQ